MKKSCVKAWGYWGWNHKTRQHDTLGVITDVTPPLCANPKVRVRVMTEEEYRWLVDRAAFYRKYLEQIADKKRKTIEQRLAASALTFWDTLHNQERKP